MKAPNPKMRTIRDGSLGKGNYDFYDSHVKAEVSTGS